MSYFTVKNLAHYQHYKERRPPWVKLHRSVLESYDFGCLQDASKWLAVGMILLASECDNQVPDDIAWIKRRLQMTSEPDVQALVNAGFIRHVGASTALASCKQNLTPEVEAEAEKETTQQQPQRFTDPDAQAAYLGYRRAHANPEAFDRTLVKLADPPSGGGFGWTVLGQALASMAGNAASFNEALARGYCRNIVTPPPVRQAPPQRGGWQKPDPSPVNFHSPAPSPKSGLCPFCHATAGTDARGRVETIHEATCHAG